MDRQELRLLFERGDVTLREWIPDAGRRAHGSGRRRDPCARVDLSRCAHRRGARSTPRRSGLLRARHKTYEAYQRITLTSPPATKMTVYGDLLRAMLADQLAFIAEPSHPRVITEDNGRESLRMSVRATAARHVVVSRDFLHHGYSTCNVLNGTALWSPRTPLCGRKRSGMFSER